MQSLSEAENDHALYVGVHKCITTRNDLSSGRSYTATVIPINKLNDAIVFCYRSAKSPEDVRYYIIYGHMTKKGTTENLLVFAGNDSLVDAKNLISAKAVKKYIMSPGRSDYMMQCTSSQFMISFDIDGDTLPDGTIQKIPVEFYPAFPKKPIK